MSDSLEASLKILNKGWRSLISGSGYKGKRTDKGEWTGGAIPRWGIIGNVRAIEITDGLVRGWHPHVLVLCFHDRQLSPEDGSLQEFRAWWSDRWARWVKRTLGRDIHIERGVDAVPVVATRVGTSPDRHITARAVRKLCTVAEVPLVTPYELQHMAITHQTDTGWSSFEIVDWAGTSEQMISSRYRHRLRRVSRLRPGDPR